MNDQKRHTATVKKELEGIKESLRVLGTRDGALNIVELLLQALKGGKGDDGYTPVKNKDYFDGKTPQKGKDYFTAADIKEVIDMVMKRITLPQKGKDYFTKEDRAEFANDLKKLLPKKGKDYFTAKEQAEMIVRMQKMIDARTVTITRSVKALETSILKDPEKIARALETLKGKNRLDASAVKNLPIPVINNISTVSGSGVGTSVSVTNLSSQCDGVTTNFLMPSYSAILMVIMTGWYPNGVLNPSTQFSTPDSTHITLGGDVTAPVSGSTLIVLYVPS